MPSLVIPPVLLPESVAPPVVCLRFVDVEKLSLQTGVVFRAARFKPKELTFWKPEELSPYNSVSLSSKPHETNVRTMQTGLLLTTARHYQIDCKNR